MAGALVTILGFLGGLLGVQAASAAGSGLSSYVSVVPYRVLGNATTGVTIGTAGTNTVQIVGTGSAPNSVPTGATAAVLNVTASNPSANGYLSLYPAGAQPNPITSNVNFVTGQSVANLVTVPLSATGAVTVYNYTGNTNVDIDVEGYYMTNPSTGAGLYNPITPNRVFGTFASGAQIGSGATSLVTVTGGTTGVPSTAGAVVVNLTAAGGSAASYLAASPAGQPTSSVSNLNWVAGQTIANRAIVQVGAAGQIALFNYNGAVNIDVDIDGYYTGVGGVGSTFVALTTPVRLTDTRSGMNGSPIGSGQTEVFNLASNATNPTIPATAQTTAVAANFTVVPGNQAGFITVFPTGITTPPTASDVNWGANEPAQFAVPNFTQANVTGATPGSTNVYNYTGSTSNLVIDAFGYFTTSTTTPTSPPNPTNPTNPVTPPTGPAGGLTVTVTPVPPSIPVNAAFLAPFTSNSKVTLTVQGAGNSPIAGDFLDMLLTPSAPGACVAPNLAFASQIVGTTLINPAPVPVLPAYALTQSFLYAVTAPTAAGTGSVTLTVPAGVAPGTCTITATEADQGASANGVITETPISDTVTAAATPSSLPASANSNSQITTTVSGPVSPAGDLVTYKFVGAAPGGCTFPGGSAGPLVLPAGPTGVVTPFFVTTTSAPTAGVFCVISVSEAATGASTLIPIDETGTFPPGNTITAAASNPGGAGGGTPPLYTAGPTNIKTAITVSVFGPAATLFTVADPLYVTAVPSVPGACGTTPQGNLGPAYVIIKSGSVNGGSYAYSATTTAAGQLKEIYTASVVAGTCAITWTEAATGATVTLNVVQVNPIDNLVLSITPSSILANGNQTATLSATATTVAGTPDGADSVAFVPFLPAGAKCGTLASDPVVSGANGVAATQYTSSTIAAPAGAFCFYVAVEAHTGGISNAIAVDNTGI